VETAKQVVDDAVALEQAGCAMLLVEAVPPEVADRIVASTTVPLIGIGAGTGCHGQVLVLQDLVGMTDQPPRFAEPVADLGRGFQQAAAEWAICTKIIFPKVQSFKQGRGLKTLAFFLSWRGRPPPLHFTLSRGWSPCNIESFVG